MSEIIRDHMVITGSVQGVGFRYRAHHLANMLGVTGWVHNEWDGSVVLEAQGTQAAINELLTRINQGSYVSIDDIRHKRLPVDERESSFRVR
jgi:acylphosphatase